MEAMEEVAMECGESGGDGSVNYLGHALTNLDCPAFNRCSIKDVEPAN